MSSVTINGANPVAFSHDADGLLTQAGALVLTRDLQNGLVTGTALEAVNDTFSYNDFRELLSYTAKVDTKAAFTTEFTRDKLGRITKKIETIGGTSHTYDYGYDLAGRLTQVKRDGTVSASYTYDSNGNRLTGPGASNRGTYDNQDRLLSYNGTTYTYTANGELKTRVKDSSATNYNYDALGNLRQVILPSGTTVDYLIDGQNRRIGKKVGGTLKQGFLYQDRLKPIAELDGANMVVNRFIYGTKVNVPEYMIKGDQTYRIITDHLGSPRLVINTTDGSVAQHIDYDEFGRVTADTSPGFQPFGFAGGLYDPDTKLVRFGTRDYDAETGRWTAKDPIMFGDGSINLYAYVANDPLNSRDPSGTSPEGIVDVECIEKCIAATTNDELNLVCNLGGKATAFGFVKKLPKASLVGAALSLGCDLNKIITNVGCVVVCPDIYGPSPPRSSSCDDYWPGDPETPTPCNPAPMCEAPPKELNYTPAGPNRSGG